MGSNIEASVDPRIAGDLQNESPLVLVVVDASPRAGFIDGAKDAGLALNRSGKIERGVVATGSRFAEAERLNLRYPGHAREGDVFVAVQIGRRRAMIETIESREP